MSEKYKEAALRHFTDAETLAGMGRFDNAGHLIGFAAECAIKFAVDLPDRERKTHLPGVAETALEALREFSGRESTPMFGLLDRNRQNFFENWSIANRYSANGTITQKMFEKWSDLAEQALGAARIRSNS